MGILKGLLGMKPLEPRATGRGIYDPVPEADLEAKLQRMREIPKGPVEGPALKPTVTLPAGTAMLGLRVDVDTHEGMRDGVPRLLDILEERGVRGTFYFAMGPDKSGRAILNVVTRPGFLHKMLRSGAPRIYSARTMLSGTLLPPRPVATAFPEIARRAKGEGHETGVHAWDHRTWQDRLNRRPPHWACNEMERGFDAYVEIFGEKPRTYAAPAWFCNNETVLYEERLALDYASDCRGTDPFLPVIDVHVCRVPQVPTTLPTLDEALGNTHADAPAFFADLLEQAAPGEWPVLTVHAELEGGSFAEAFSAFLAACTDRGIAVVPLRELLALRLATGKPLPRCTLSYASVDGRAGAVSVQMFEV